MNPSVQPAKSGQSYPLSGLLEERRAFKRSGTQRTTDEGGLTADPAVILVVWGAGAQSCSHYGIHTASVRVTHSTAAHHGRCCLTVTASRSSKQRGGRRVCSLVHCPHGLHDVSARVGLSYAEGRQSPHGLQLFPSLRCAGIPSPRRAPRAGRKGSGARGGAVCTYFQQGLLDDAADVPSPLRDVRVVVVQVWRKGQAKRSELLWGDNSREITVKSESPRKEIFTPMVYAKS